MTEHNAEPAPRKSDPAEKLPPGRKLGFTVAAVCAALLLIEGSARAWLALFPPTVVEVNVANTAVETNWLRVLNRDLTPVEGTIDLYLPDVELFWELRPNTTTNVENRVYRTRGEPVRWSIRINADGQRGRAYPEGDRRAAPIVVCLGDSCTFGFRVNDVDTYPIHIERYLHEHGMPEAAVVNYGVPGYSSFQGKRLLTYLLSQHRPDVVVFAFGANDHEQDRYSDAEKARRISRTHLKVARFLEYLAIARLLRGTPKGQRAELDETSLAATRVSPDEFRDNLSAMAQAARDAGAEVILLDLVFLGPLYGQTIADVAREQGVPWLDGRQVLRDGLADLHAGKRFRAEREGIDLFWTEQVQSYRGPYYSESFYRKLFEDPVWRDLLRYLMIEPVHANPLGNRLIAERVGESILPAAER